jgi:hypothetical protein
MAEVWNFAVMFLIKEMRNLEELYFIFQTVPKKRPSIVGRPIM